MAFSDWHSRKSDAKPQGGDRQLLGGPALTSLASSLCCYQRGFHFGNTQFPCLPSVPSVSEPHKILNRFVAWN